MEEVFEIESIFEEFNFEVFKSIPLGCSWTPKDIKDPESCENDIELTEMYGSFFFDS
jgi:hypothetical protein